MSMKLSEVLTSLRPEGDGWVVNVPDDWQQGRTVFGGLQVALAVRAMRAVMTTGPARPLRSLQATFVGPMPTGSDVRLRAERLRTGRSATHARCDMLCEGAVACTVVGIFGVARPSSVSLEIPRPLVAGEPEALKDMPYIPGITPPFVQHLQLRWAAGRRPYTGHHEPRSVIFARLPDRGCTGEDTLIALADSPPTPALSMLTAVAPASSLNWTLELLGDPQTLDREQWSLIETEVRAGADGYLSQTSILWGASGHAFAVSHQSVAIFG